MYVYGNAQNGAMLTPFQEDNIFVNRVSKRDAPNYYDIITRPMYLNLMAKKLKQGDYMSKAEFQVLPQCFDRLIPRSWSYLHPGAGGH